MKKFMKDINLFKEYMTSIFRPYYLRDYVNGVNDVELLWFYNQMIEPMEFLVDENYFFYKFNWIRKRNFKDLSFEIYKEYLYKPECLSFPIIKENWINILDERYSNEFRHLYFSLLDYH